MTSKTYKICGYVDIDTCIEIGTFETKLPLRDIWQLIVQIFDDGNYPEGIVAKDYQRRIKWQ